MPGLPGSNGPALTMVSYGSNPRGSCKGVRSDGTDDGMGRRLLFAASNDGMHAVRGFTVRYQQLLHPLGTNLQLQNELFLFFSQNSINRPKKPYPRVNTEK